MVLKISPPLIVTEEQLGHFVDGIGEIVELMHSGGRFWSEALGMARRVIGSSKRVVSIWFNSPSSRAAINFTKSRQVILPRSMNCNPIIDIFV